MKKHELKTSHVVRNEDGEAVDVSKALLDALAEEMPDLAGDDDDDDLPEVGGKQTGEMRLLIKMVKKGKYTPRTEYEMGCCQMLKVRGYATTEDNKRFAPTSDGRSRALELKPSLRFRR